jgi:hypothetical protein
MTIKPPGERLLRKVQMLRAVTFEALGLGVEVAEEMQKAHFAYQTLIGQDYVWSDEDVRADEVDFMVKWLRDEIKKAQSH